jgi:transcriptional regulator with GAF, ATPase, and Fis domain
MTGIERTSDTTDVSDLLDCVAAFARSLTETFDPTRSLSEFSARAQRLIPHDHLAIHRREADGRTCSLFAEYAVRGAPLCHGAHYTMAFERGHGVPAEDLALGPVFAGHTQVVADMLTDPRFSEAPALRASIVEAGLRARLAVPLSAGGRVRGAFVVMSGAPGVYTDATVSSCRRLAGLVAPFVEGLVEWHRERRLRERMKAAAALPAILGTSLKLGDVLERLAEAVRPLIDFEVMGLALRNGSEQRFERVGLVGGDGRVNPESGTLEEFSKLERIARGEVVLIRDAPRELDPARPGDRLMINNGDRSALDVPIFFGERVGGVLFFVTSRAYWYDEADVEVASVIAVALALEIQHQRLAEHQQRLGAAEAKARTLERQVASLRTALDERFGFDAIIGRAPRFLAAVDGARKVAATGTTVLLTGESGTGKEVLARAIHQASARADGPFVAVNCAALPETLVETELFGHERGAFTGADRLRRGRFELAAGGTLFLDEVGDLPPAVQGKLLRVLQERQYERVGGTTTLQADVRLIAATNRDLERAVAEGRFRDDLYFRLAVFPIRLPALRERGADVLLLAEHFVRTLGARMGRHDLGLSGEARDLLLAHAWPGNIRELQNAIERALILAEGALISAEHLEIVPRPPRDVTAAAIVAPPPEVPAAMPTIVEQQKRLIVEALRRTRGNKARAAAALGLSRTQLLRRIRRFNLDV